MTFAVLPRSTIGAPTPPSGRSKIPVPCRHLLVHYTGAGTYGDGRRVDTVEASSIATYGKNVGKPYEYNYMVGWQGNVYMQAGEFVGQHCLNFNSQSMGVLLILGVGIPLSAAMVDAFREFRQWMVDEGRLAPDHEVVPHYRYRSTSCCAQAAEPKGARWNSPTGEGNLGNVITPLLKPWLKAAPIEPPPEPPQEDDDMLVYIEVPDAPTRFIGTARGSPGVDLVVHLVEWSRGERHLLHQANLPHISLTRGQFGGTTLLGAIPTHEGWARGDFAEWIPGAA